MHASGFVRYSYLSGLVFAFLSCSSTSPPPPPPNNFDKTALLTAVADCTMGRLAAFEAAAVTLRDTTRDVAADRTPNKRIAAQNAWRQAMALWQEAELFAFGPAAPSMEPGGQGLRDQVYGWPLFNRCQVDEQLVQQTYSQPNFGASPINGRGLGAIEYLLFYEGIDNACSQFSPINMGGGASPWAALSADTLSQRKAQYAAAAAEDVLSRARALVAAWDPARGNFRAQLVTAGKGSTTYATDQAALNAVGTALFYLERYVKDLKVGRPAGLYECFMMTCPEGLESKYARESSAHVRANILGFRRLFDGCMGQVDKGFDDWLVAVGMPTLADRTRTEVDGALAALDGLGMPLEEAVASNLPAVQNLHRALKGVTDLIKSEFISVLDLELPKAIEGDND